jgi:hypothetical protein
MEFWRKKNVDTRLVFPIQKNDGTFITSAAGLDSEYALLGAHAGGAPSFSDCAHEATEIGATGLYYLDVSAAEINDDASVIQVKSSSTGAVVQVLLIRTTMSDADVINWKGSAAAAMTGDAYAAVDTEVGTLGTNVLLALKLLRNKVTTDPSTGVMTIYDDDNTTALYTADIYEDVAGSVAFDGAGANRRNRLA